MGECGRSSHSKTTCPILGGQSQAIDRKIAMQHVIRPRLWFLCIGHDATLYASQFVGIPGAIGDVEGSRHVPASRHTTGAAWLRNVSAASGWVPQRLGSAVRPAKPWLLSEFNVVESAQDGT